MSLTGSILDVALKQLHHTRTNLGEYRVSPIRFKESTNVLFPSWPPATYIRCFSPARIVRLHSPSAISARTTVSKASTENHSLCSAAPAGRSASCLELRRNRITWASGQVDSNSKRERSGPDPRIISSAKAEVERARKSKRGKFSEERCGDLRRTARCPKRNSSLTRILFA